jgi:uncharacterized membrane-anchored protein
MTSLYHPLHKDMAFIKLLAVVGFVIVVVVMWHFLTVGTCLHYTSQTAAQKDLSTYPSLDGHPKDGLACNSYFK